MHADDELGLAIAALLLAHGVDDDVVIASAAAIAESGLSIAAVGRIAGADRMSWAESGACRSPDVDLGWFFPVRGNHGRRAKAVCAGCAVRAACLRYAVRRPELEGVWGGTSARERVALRVRGGLQRDRR